MVARVGVWCHENRWRAVALWAAGLAALIASVITIGDGFDAEQSIPDSETERGFEVLDEYFGGVGNGLSGQIVFTADQGVDDPAVVAAMSEMFTAANGIEFVTVTSPYEGRGGAIAADGMVAFAEVALDREVSEEESGQIGDEIAALTPDLEGLTVEIGGEELAGFEPPSSELIGVSFAVFILILATGSVIAMGLSIGAALLGVGGGLALTTLVSNIAHGPQFATTFAVMIGLGVGIDYALFIITRYRDVLHGGATPSEAIAKAMATAGRAVLFAGLTVVLSLLGLIAIGLPFVTGIGVSAASTVLVTLFSSLTLLPALLGFAAGHVELTRVRGVIASALVGAGLLGIGLGVTGLAAALPIAVAVLIAGFFVAPLKKALPARTVKPLKETVAYRWSRLVQSRPWTVAIAGTAVLLGLTAPILGLRLGFSDEGNFAEDTTTRRAYDLVAEGFGPGFNGPFLITAVVNDDGDTAVVPRLIAALDADPGVAAVVGPLPSNPEDPDASEAFVLQAIPTTAPQDLATETLVATLREEVIPAAVAGSTLDVALTGGTAAGIDFSDYLAGRTLLFFGAVLTISFLLLMAVFRSLLVPLKAVIMNLLSISAAYGVVVAVFQWGWLSHLTNIQPAPIEPFIPMMMFAVVFGLSMDYEVFLISRIREEYDRTGDPVESVADGLAGTARVITAAAAIMAVVFGSFLLEDNRIIQLMGTGLASAIILDATLVRMLLVPATMELLGSRNWWIPDWLDRLLPRIELEGPAASGN
jgi:putative drug exporter of the RND superfamily